MFQNRFLRKSYRLCDNMKKYRKAGQAKDENVIRPMRFACWIAKSTNTRSQYVILTVYRRSSGSRAPHNITLHVHCLSCWRQAVYVCVLNWRSMLISFLIVCAIIVKISNSGPWIVISNPQCDLDLLSRTWSFDTLTVMCVRYLHDCCWLQAVHRVFVCIGSVCVGESPNGLH